MNFLATFFGSFFGMMAAGLVFTSIQYITDSDDETT